MNHEYRTTNLVLVASPEDREMLRLTWETNPGYFGTSAHECEFMDNYLANCELSWIDPADTGDMTDAPMLGLVGEPVPLEALPASRYGEEMCGFTCEGARSVQLYAPILKRWVYKHYAMRSFLTDLADTGEATFASE